MFEHLEAAHARHDDIKKHGAKALGAREYFGKALVAVLGLINGVKGGKDVFEDGPVDGVVVDNEQPARGVARRKHVHKTLPPRDSGSFKNHQSPARRVARKAR